MATTRIPVVQDVFVALGLKARIAYNDVPITGTPLTGAHSRVGGINHRLVAGTNRLDVEIERHRAYQTRDDPLEEPYFEITIKKAKTPGSAEAVILHHFELPKDWDRVDEERRTFPFHHHVTFEPDVALARMRFLDAEPVEVPCEGTPAMRDLIQEVVDAVGAGDRDRLVALSRPQLEDYAAAFEGEASASLGAQLQELDEALAEQLQVAPVDPATLHFRSRAGGRVVEVTRTDLLPVLRARGSGEEAFHYETNFLITKISGNWRVM